jgi:hypothetical protein
MEIFALLKKVHKKYEAHPVPDSVGTGGSFLGDTEVSAFSRLHIISTHAFMAYTGATFNYTLP